MPTRKLITFSTIGNSELVDVELPGDAPLKELIPDLAAVLFDNHKRLPLEEISLFDLEGRRVNLAKSLDAQKILNSERLLIQVGKETQAASPDPGEKSIMLNTGKWALPVSRKLISPDDALNELAKDRRGSINLGLPSDLELEHPCLLYEDGLRGYLFILDDSIASIGRPRQGYQPDIDIGEIDVAKVSSRPHAEIEKIGKKFVLRALKATNGMFVNDAEVPENEVRILEDRDVLQFGFQGVRLIFRLANTKPQKKK